ncbi:hypothetical protein ACF8Q9_02155 [Pseudomonas sp. TYF_15]|uniref:hypothetical protein n=1 Tax=Pseudomonas sp. TYF_15 TaxID=3367194 RepID=UPI00370BB554
MSFLDLTPGSTHATDAAVKRHLPEAEASRVLAYFDRLQALEAKQPNPAHARAARSASIEALILKALNSATLRADLAAVAPCYRVSKVISHLNRYSARYNIEKAPCRKKVHEVLQQHGYL